MAFEELSAANEELWVRQETPGSDYEAPPARQSDTEGISEVTESPDIVLSAGEIAAGSVTDINEYYRRILPHGLVSPPRGRSFRGRR